MSCHPSNPLLTFALSLSPHFSSNAPPSLSPLPAYTYIHRLTQALSSSPSSLLHNSLTTNTEYFTSRHHPTPHPICPSLKATCARSSSAIIQGTQHPLHQIHIARAINIRSLRNLKAKVILCHIPYYQRQRLFPAGTC